MLYCLISFMSEILHLLMPRNLLFDFNAMHSRSPTLLESPVRKVVSRLCIDGIAVKVAYCDQTLETLLNARCTPAHP